MKEFSRLRPLCGVALLIFSAAVAAEVCFENLDNIVLEDPDTQDTQTYPLAPQDVPCTEGGNLVMPFSLAQRGLTCAMLDGQLQPIDDPIRVPLGTTVPLNVRIAATTIPVTNVVVNDSADNCDGGFPSVTTDPTDHGCSADADDVINASVTVSGTGVPGVVCVYNIQPNALEIFNVNPQTQAVAVGDNGDPIAVSVRSINPGTSISNVNIADNRGGSCTPSNQTVDDSGTVFSCNVANLPSASPVNGTLTASGNSALADTAGYTLEPLGLVVTNVSPSLDGGVTSVQVVNIGDSGDVAVSVLSNGSAISNVTVTDNRGGSCVPLNGTTVASTGTFVWDCAVAPLLTGSPANGTLTANAAGVTSDNAGYTINPTQITVTVTEPGCADPGVPMTLQIDVTHNGPATVNDVDLTVTGVNPAGVCDVNLNLLAGQVNDADCTFTPAGFPVSGTASTSTTNANDDSDNYSVNQCQGQLPAYCSDPEHNAVLAPGVVTNIMSLGNAQIGFWNNGAWFNSPGSTENVNFASNTILALPFQPPGPGQGGGDNVNNGRITMTRPGTGARVSISDCPGDFSDERPFQSHPQYGNDTALGFSDPSPDPGDHPCRVGGATSITLKWAMSAGAAIDLNTCVMLVPGQTYYLNVGQISPDGSGGWTGNGCTGSGCIVSMEQGTE